MGRRRSGSIHAVGVVTRSSAHGAGPMGCEYATIDSGRTASTSRTLKREGDNNVGVLRAYGPRGEELWSRRPDDIVPTPPVVLRSAEGLETVVVASGSRLSAYRQDGSSIWRLTLDSPVPRRAGRRGRQDLRSDAEESLRDPLSGASVLGALTRAARPVHGPSPDSDSPRPIFTLREGGVRHPAIGRPAGLASSRSSTSSLCSCSSSHQVSGDRWPRRSRVAGRGSGPAEGCRTAPRGGVAHSGRALPIGGPVRRCLFGVSG